MSTNEKRALCVQKTAVWQLGIMPHASHHTYGWDDKLFDLPHSMVPRAQCETDPSLLQLITYSVVLNSAGDIFCYERGVQSGEDRLKAKLSIGVGGHIDRMPGQNESLYMLCAREAAREIEEEVGLNVHFSELFDKGFVYEEHTEVGRVHFGLVYFYPMSPYESLGDHEQGHIENGKFMNLAELLRPETFDRLELWSQAVVRGLVDDVVKAQGEIK